MLVDKHWICNSTDGEGDGKARVLGVFKTREEAKNYVDEDIKEWIDQRADEGCECDFDKMAAWYDYDSSQRCEWNIEEVDFAMSPIHKSKVKAAEKVLVDNGIEEDEASTVLQAIGYALLDVELYS